MPREIATDSSVEAIRRAMEENIVEYWRLMTEPGTVVRMRELNGALTYGPVHRPSPFRDCVLRTRWSVSDAESRIDETLAVLGWPETGVIWWALPSSKPRDVSERLIRRGFTLRGTQPGMALVIERLRTEEPQEGVTIEVAQDAAALRTVGDTLMAGFGSPPEFQQVFTEMQIAVGDDQRWKVYLGSLNGAPAGTTIAVFGAGIVGIYGVSVRTEARRHGIAGALTSRALRDARGMGYRIATLRASEMGEPVYRRLGFERCCTIEQYMGGGEE